MKISYIVLFMFLLIFNLTAKAITCPSSGQSVDIKDKFDLATMLRCIDTTDTTNTTFNLKNNIDLNGLYDFTAHF